MTKIKRNAQVFKMKLQNANKAKAEYHLFTYNSKRSQYNNM